MDAPVDNRFDADADDGADDDADDGADADVDDRVDADVRDAKSEQHEQLAAAIFPPAVLIFGLPTQKIC